MGTYCERCGATLVPGARFCESCGAPVAQGDAVAVAPGQQPSTQPADQIPAMASGGTCPRCGTPYQAGMSFCQGCGAPIAPVVSVPPAAPPAVPVTPATCPRCGAPAAPGTRFCQSCGQPLEGSAPTPRPAGFAGLVPEPVSPEPVATPEPVAVTPYVVRTSTGEHLELELPAVLGKGSAARVIIDGNPAISRAHARVSRTDEGCQIEDLGSTNGTFVDGVRLTAGVPASLADGAVVVLANEELVFHVG